MPKPKLEHAQSPWRPQKRAWLEAHPLEAPAPRRRARMPKNSAIAEDVVAGWPPPEIAPDPEPLPRPTLRFGLDVDLERAADDAALAAGARVHPSVLRRSEQKGPASYDVFADYRRMS